MAVAPMLISQSTPLDAFERLDLAGQGLREGFELLAQRHGHGVLELRAPHLEDRGELLALGAEGRDQLLHGGHELDCCRAPCPRARTVG